MHRRTFLRTLGATAAGALLTRPARADHYDHQPDHVTLEYAQADLDTYRPALVTRALPADNRPTLHGWKATSPEFDTDAYAYACEYAVQEGVSPFAPPLTDSHPGDHEWIYVFVDTSTGDVVEVAYAAYHWLRGTASGAAIPLNDGTHPQAHIVDPWHHYRLTDEAGELLTVEDLTDAFQWWLDNGLEKDLQPGTVTNPWRMRAGGRDHWWRDTAGSFSADAFYARQTHRLGLFGAQESDL